MNSVLALYQKIDDPIKASKEVGIWLARSGMLGQNQTAETGSVIALDAFARGIPITEIPLNYHLVNGRITMKAEAMLAGFHELGGKHSIIEQSADACSVKFSIDDECETFTTTWEEAQKESWPYGKDGKTIKSTWAGPVGRADMLWARTVSRAVRKLRPSICGGKYTPEEIQDLPEYAEAISGNGKATEPAEPVDVEALLKANGARAAAANPIKPAAPKTVAADEPAGSAPGSDPATPPVASVAHEDTLQATAADPAPAASEDGYATAAQVKRIVDLYIELSVPVEAQDKALKSRGVSALRSLTFDQAADLLGKLEAKAKATNTSKLPDHVTSYPDSAPADQSQIDAIVAMVKEIGESDPDFPAKYKAWLQSQGKQRTADLSVRQASAMLVKLGVRNLESFFGRSLEQHVEDHDERLAIQGQ